MADRTYTNDERANIAYVLVKRLHDARIVTPELATLLMQGSVADVQAHVLQLMIDKHVDANDAAVILQHAFDRAADEARREAERNPFRR